MIHKCKTLMLGQNSFSLFFVTDLYIFFIKGECKWHLTMIPAAGSFKKLCFLHYYYYYYYYHHYFFFI